MGRSTYSKANLLSTLLDVVIVIVSMALAYVIRFRLLAGIDRVGTIWYHLAWAAAMSPVLIFFFGLKGASDYRSTSLSLTQLMGRVVSCTSTAVMLLIVCVFVFRLVDMSRLLLVLFWAILTFLSCLKLAIMRKRLQAFHAQGIACRRVIVVGSGDNARHYGEGIANEPACPYKVIGSVGMASIGGSCEHLGNYRQLDRVLDHKNPDEVVVALDPYEQRLIDDLLITCERSGCRVSVVPAYHDYLSSRSLVTLEGGTPVINMGYVPIDNIGYAFLKRLFDIIGSLILIVLTSPIMLIAVIGTKLSSPGPIIFAQTRVGRGKHLFKMYKFRSMRVNDEESTAWTTAQDPRKTKFGSFMRRFSIDELPQLFNVLKGDMSLVGPRPELPTYVERFKVSVPLYMVRHQVRPGMTGWAQVNGLRGDTSITDRVTYDLYYINNWSLLFDLRILLMTPLKGVLENDQESLA